MADSITFEDYQPGRHPAWTYRILDGRWRIIHRGDELVDGQAPDRAQALAQQLDQAVLFGPWLEIMAPAAGSAR